MRDYNKRLPAGASKLQVFGFDVSGSPGNFSATRGPDTALTVALEYLRAVDPEPAAQILGRVGAFLPRLKSGSYGDLQQAERDSLTAAISDLIALVEHRRFQCIKKNLPNDCEWGQRAAIGAQQVDTWWRQMPVGWKAADGYEWTREASQTRESSMGDNLEWIAKRIGVRGRMLVFGAVAHIASTSFRLPDAPEREMFPFGAYARAHFGSDYLSILNMIVDGEIANCTANERKPISLKPSPIPSVESQFSSVNVPRYVIDLRNAPPLVLQWLRQPHDHWNGFGSMRFPTAGAFDLAFYASPITSACGYL
jgi:erythromycin esterase-like protein